MYLISKQKISSRLDNKAKSRFHLRILSFYRLIYGISIFCLPVFIVFVPFFRLKNFNVIKNNFVLFIKNLQTNLECPLDEILWRCTFYFHNFIYLFTVTHFPLIIDSFVKICSVTC